MTSRIYIVTHRNPDKPIALVRAVSQSQAIRAAIGDNYQAEVASQDDLIECLNVLDMKVIDATEKEASNG